MEGISIASAYNINKNKQKEIVFSYEDHPARVNHVCVDCYGIGNDCDFHHEAKIVFNEFHWNHILVRCPMERKTDSNGKYGMNGKWQKEHKDKWEERGGGGTNKSEWVSDMGIESVPIQLKWIR